MERATNHERFGRWQGRARDDFGQAANLVLALAIGILGFSISFALRPDFIISGPVKLAFDSSLAYCVLSIGAGMFAMCLRLFDARFTAKIVRLDEKGASKARLRRARYRLRQLGMASWFWFYFQLLAFGAGAWFLIVSLVWKYHNRLL